VPGQLSTKMEWVRDKMKWDGITIFSDHHLTTDIATRVDCPIKIGWLQENRGLQPQLYESFEDWAYKFKYVMTHDKYLLETYPHMTRKIPFGGCWIAEENMKVWPKTKHSAMIYSDKRWLPGHILRHEIASLGLPGLDLFGRGTPRPIRTKEEGLVDYHFALILENVKADNYFTEKLLDALATGTIPIYYGCPNIGDYFIEDGITTFNSIDELKELWPTLTHELYHNKRQAIEDNLQLMKPYILTEDWILENILNVQS